GLSGHFNGGNAQIPILQVFQRRAGGLRKVHGQLQRLDKIDRGGNFNAAAGDGDVLSADLVPLPVQKNIVELLVYRGGSAAEIQHYLGGDHLVHVFLPAAEGQLRGL